MTSQSKQTLMILAAAGLAAGISGCGGSTLPADAAAQEPSMEKHGCKTDADGKHSCGGEMKDDMKGESTVPAPSADAPAPKTP